MRADSRSVRAGRTHVVGGDSAVEGNFVGVVFLVGMGWVVGRVPAVVARTSN